MWTALTRLDLPVHEEREVWPGVKVLVPNGEVTTKLPGDKITKKEMADHQQGDEAIAALVNGKAIEEDA